MADLRKRTVYITVGSLTAHVAGLAAAAILSRILNKDVYGTYRQAFLLYQILVGVMGLNLGASLLFFLPRSDADKQRGIVAQSVLIGLLVGLAVGGVMFVGSPLMGQAMANPDVVPLLYIIAVFAVFNQVTQMVPNALIAVDKAPLVLLYTTVTAAGRMAFTVVPFLAGMDLTMVFRLITLWEVLLAGLGLYLMHSRIGINLRSVTWRGLREEFEYMWPLLAAAILGTLSREFDKAVIAVAFDPAAYAEYANGALQLPLVMIVISSLSTSVLPEMSRYAGEGRIDAMLNLWHRVTVKGAMLVFPTVVFCLLCPDYLVTLLYGEKYLKSAIPFSIYCAGLFIRITYYGAVFQALGRNRHQIIGAVVGLAVGIALTVTLVFLGRGTVLAFAGPAIGAAGASAVSAVVLMALISRATGCPFLQVLPLPQLARIGLLALAAAIPTVAVRLISWPEPIKIALMAGVFGALYLAIGLRLRIVSHEDVRLVYAPLARAWQGVTRLVR